MNPKVVMMESADDLELPQPDLDFWRRSIADGRLSESRPEDVVAAVQAIGPNGDGRVVRALTLHIADELSRRLRRMIGKNHPNPGLDIIDQAHDQLIEAVLKPKTPDEPGVALCGVDNPTARAALENAGFDLVVEAGLGAGPESFRSFSLHTFPSSMNAAKLWSRDVGPTAPDVKTLPAYVDLAHEGLDECGLAQLASRTVGVPFVGLIAGGLVIGELLRRLHGAPGLELVSGSAFNLSDTELVMGDFKPYA